MSARGEVEDVEFDGVGELPLGLRRVAGSVGTERRKGDGLFGRVYWRGVVAGIAKVSYRWLK